MGTKTLVKNGEPTAPENSPQITSISVLLGRIIWTFFGPVMLLLVTFQVATHRGWFTPWDAAFAVLVLLMLAGRWIEQRSGEATTLWGEPSTLHDLHRYLWVLLVATAVIWTGANIVSNHVLSAMH
jgi:hypothetical protein